MSWEMAAQITFHSSTSHKNNGKEDGEAMDLVVTNSARGGNHVRDGPYCSVNKPPQRQNGLILKYLWLTVVYTHKKTMVYTDSLLTTCYLRPKLCLKFV